jgi:tetratricopeptide (TPR) repeat protein
VWVAAGFWCGSAAAPGAVAANPQAPECAQQERLREEAERLVAEQRLAEAAEVYRVLVKCAPRWAEGWWRLGSVEYDRGDFLAARNAFSSLIALHPENGLGYLFRGLAWLKTQHWPEALADLREARSRALGGERRLQVLAVRSEATALCRLGRYDEAFPLLRQLVNAEPHNPGIHELMGVAVLRLVYPAEGLPPAMQELARRAGLAFSRAETGQVLEGRREFEELLQERPDLPHGRYAYGVLLLAQDPDGAVLEFEKELRRDPNHLPALLQLGNEMLQREQRDRARLYIERALQVEPRSPAALGLMGRLLMEVGDMAAAAHWLEEAVRLAPENQKLHIQLARVYFRLGRREDALREQAIVEQLGASQGEVSELSPETGRNPPP